MRLDSDIKRDVEDELHWDPDLDAIDIGVTVHNGVVTLVSDRAPNRAKNCTAPRPLRAGNRPA
jgi:osmotically-inducible protein OsmY